MNERGRPAERSAGIILVTGGTGTLGRPLVARLREAGRPVRVLSRHAGEAAEGAERVTGDLIAGEGVDAAVEAAEVIVHCAGTRGAKDDEVQTRNLVAAAAWPTGSARWRWARPPASLPTSPGPASTSSPSSCEATCGRRASAGRFSPSRSPARPPARFARAPSWPPTEPWARAPGRSSSPTASGASGGARHGLAPTRRRRASRAPAGGGLRLASSA